MDLTPYYPHEPDVVRFHAACRDALAPFGPHLHPRFKKWCDEYFYLKHRAEPRGVVTMSTGFGGERIVTLPVGEQLPRIC